MRYLTVHQPAGFDDFVREVGSPAGSVDVRPGEPPPDPALLTEIARRHDIEILGPPLAP